MDQRIAYHHLLAQNFLRNISLDGSHTDTAFRLFVKGDNYAVPSTSTASSSCMRAQDVAITDFADGVAESDATRVPVAVGNSDLGDKVILRSSTVDETQTPSRKVTGSSSIMRKLSAKLRRTDSGKSQQRQSIFSRLISLRAGTMDSTREEKTSLNDDEFTPRNRQSRSTTPIPFDGSFDAKMFKAFSRDPTGMARLVKQSATEIFSPLRPFDFTNVDEISYSAILESSDQTSGGESSSKPSYLTSPSPVQRILSAEPPRQATEGSKDPLLSARSSLTPFSAPVSKQSSVVQSAPYDPLALNNPSFGPDTYKTTLAFTSFMSSVLDYVNPAELKREVNAKFRDQFPDVNVTYSKLQSIKREMRVIARSTRLDHVTLAHAYVYFEKLVLRGLVCKPNRKLVAGVCLILAAKLHDTKGNQLRELFDAVELTFRESRKELLLYEIPVAVFLEFALILERFEYEPHFKLLLWQ